MLLLLVVAHLHLVIIGRSVVVVVVGGVINTRSTNKPPTWTNAKSLLATVSWLPSPLSLSINILQILIYSSDGNYECVSTAGQMQRLHWMTTWEANKKCLWA